MLSTTPRSPPSSGGFRDRLLKLAQEHETVLAERDDLRVEVRSLRSGKVRLCSSNGSQSPVRPGPDGKLRSLDHQPAPAPDAEPPNLLEDMVLTDVPSQAPPAASKISLHVPGWEDERRQHLSTFSSSDDSMLPKRLSRFNTDRSDEAAWSLATLDFQEPSPTMSNNPWRLRGEGAESVGLARGRKMSGEQRLRDIWTHHTDEEIVSYWNGQITMTVDPENCITYLRRRQMKRRGTAMTRALNPSTWILHPAGPYCLVWNILCIHAILYDVIIMPAEAFQFDRQGLYSYVEWFLTVFWTIDLILSFRTGYFIGAYLEMSQKQIALHYLQSCFVLDLVIVLVEWSSKISLTLSSASLLRTTRVMRTFRLMKLFRLGKVKEIWTHLRDQVNSVVFHICVSLIVLSMCVSVGVHLTSCFWYWLGTSEADGWVMYEAYEGRKDVVFWYVASARWSIAQLNGRTDEDDRRNMKERAFACFTGVVLAVIIKTTFISVVTKTVLNLSALRSSKIRRQTLVNEYLDNHNISIGLQVSVKRYMHDYDDSRDACSKEEQVMAFLPRSLQGDILYEIRGPPLANHPLFQSLGVAKQATMRHICHAAVKQVSPLKGEILFDTGDACSRMLFTVTGKVEYGEPATLGVEASDFSSTSLSSGASESKPVATPASNAFRLLRANSHRVTPQGRGIAKWHRPVDFAEIPVDPDSAVSVNNGSWISEAALWVKWTNKKRCAAATLAILYAVDAEALSQVLSRHADAYAVAHLYATLFVNELSCAEELSDICNFQIKVGMPSRFVPTPIRITIVAARGLSKASESLIFTDKCNTFCVCKIVGDNEQFKRAAIKTELKEDTAEPVWNHSGELAVCMDQTLEFSVWDHNFVKEDKLMGSASLPAAYVLRKGFVGELQLRGVAATGKLKVRIEL
eukprot:TRINITY_DN34328_c0_g1_i1.p1 TRINITY_DN34328_c0_g1~~TRINITY_DN34328_c0_g1_i1.p1  ORF type:complete len:913 (+),score=183.54 TRINITY_DN34328_c0_g1_i1:79-2817(+)